MTRDSNRLAEGTLDPADWEAVRALGHRMVDDMMDYIQTVRERPAWEHIPDQVKARFDVLGIKRQSAFVVSDRFIAPPRILQGDGEICMAVRVIRG